MQNKAHLFLIVVALAGLIFVPGTSAQPGNQPFVFYSEDPFGGSYLGVDTQDVSADRVGELHLKEERGVEVTMVDQDAPAGKAGLKERDVILSINDQKVESVEQLRRLIHEIPSGRTITIGISRDGQPMTLKAQLAERDKVINMDHAFNFTMPPINIPAVHIPAINMPQIDVPSIVVIHSPARSGMLVENLTPQLGDFFGVKNGNGVLVRSVEKGSRAEQAGFHAGDVIVKIDGTVVNDCSDFTRLLRKHTDNKASVTVMRDRKEQNFTLALPEAKRTGELKDENCEIEDAGDCGLILSEDSEMAMVVPELQTAQIELRQSMEGLKKQLHQTVSRDQAKVKKEMEKVQREFQRQQREMEQQLMKLKKEADI